MTRDIGQIICGEVTMTPLRSIDQIKQLSKNFCSLARQTEKLHLPDLLVQSINENFDSTGHTLPQIFEGMRSKWHMRAFGTSQFVNCISGNGRDGFTKDELDWEKLSLDIQRSSESIFPENGDRHEQISKYLTLSDSKGLAMGFHTEGDFCLELWGDLLKKKEHFHGIDLMVVVPEAFTLAPLKGGAMHAFDDSSQAWRMMCSALLYPDNPSDKLSYEELSWVFDDIPKPVGSIDPSSPLGQVFRKWKVWCTSVCPWLKNKKNTGNLPSHLLKEPEIIAYLALQIAIFQPKNILFMGSDKTAYKILTRAVKGLNWQSPIFQTPHPSASVLYKKGADQLWKLRKRLPSINHILQEATSEKIMSASSSIEREDQFEASVDERSESYEHTESSVSLYESYSEIASEEYTENSNSFQEIPDYTTDFTNEFTGEFTNSWSEDEPESEEMYSENISESQHIEKQTHRSNKSGKQKKVTERKKKHQYDRHSTNKVVNENRLQKQHEESYIDRENRFLHMRYTDAIVLALGCFAAGCIVGMLL